jgi:hypothetical protein
MFNQWCWIFENACGECHKRSENKKGLNNQHERCLKRSSEVVHDFGNYDGTADVLKEYDEVSTLRNSAEDGEDSFWGGGKILLMMALRMI